VGKLGAEEVEVALAGRVEGCTDMTRSSCIVRCKHAKINDDQHSDVQWLALHHLVGPEGRWLVSSETRKSAAFRVQLTCCCAGTACLKHKSNPAMAHLHRLLFAQGSECCKSPPHLRTCFTRNNKMVIEDPIRAHFASEQVFIGPVRLPLAWKVAYCTPGEVMTSRVACVAAALGLSRVRRIAAASNPAVLARPLQPIFRSFWSMLTTAPSDILDTLAANQGLGSGRRKGLNFYHTCLHTKHMQARLAIVPLMVL
jgi:hypothetical protein